MRRASASPAIRVSASPAGAPVEDYLDRLLLTLSESPRQIRRTLAEVEAHLQDLVHEGIAAGLPPSQAEAEVVRGLARNTSASAGHADLRPDVNRPDQPASARADQEQPGTHQELSDHGEDG